MEEEDVDNPFLPGGELDQEATAILRSSTIQRNALSIYDPDNDTHGGDVDAADGPVAVVETDTVEVVINPVQASRVHFSPRHSNDATPVAAKPTTPVKNASPVKTKVSASGDGLPAPSNGGAPVENGGQQEGLVSSAKTQPLQAETVQVGGSDKQRKCCDLM